MEFDDIITGFLFVGLMLLVLLIISLSYLIICIKQKIDRIYKKISNLDVFVNIKNKAETVLDISFDIMYRAVSLLVKIK